MQEQTDFQKRAILPLMIPLAIIGAIAVIVGAIALLLTYLPQEVGNVVAFMAAAGVLTAFALVATQDKTDNLKKGGAALAVVAPLAFGGVLAATDICGSDDYTCPSEFEEAIRFPAWAPTVVSTQAAAFDNTQVTLPAVPPEEAEELVIVFSNQANISHNLYVSQTMERPADESGLLPSLTEDDDAAVAITPTFAAGDEAVFFLPPEPGEYLYYCSIHEGMDGTLTVAEDAEITVDGEPVEAR